jgi:hypothetical protein
MGADLIEHATGEFSRAVYIKGGSGNPLVFKATVTTYTDTTHFKASGLAGFGNDYFGGPNNSWYVYALRDSGGAGALPQGEDETISDYVSSDGTFTHTAFTTPLAVGDEVLIVHAWAKSAAGGDATAANQTLILADIGDASASTLLSLYGILGNPSASLATTILDGVDARANNANLNALLGVADAAGRSINGNIGDFQAQTNLQTLLAALGIPDTAAKPLYTCLVTDRLDHGTYGLSALQTDVAAVNTDIGDFSAQVNLQSLLASLGVPDVAAKPLYTCLVTDRLDHATYGLSALDTELALIPQSGGAVSWNATALAAIQGEAEDALEGENLDHIVAVTTVAADMTAEVVDGSVISRMLSKTSDTSTYNPTTDAQEMLSDKFGGFSGDGGAAQDDSVKASMDIAHTETGKIPKSDAAVTWNATALQSIQDEAEDALEGEDLDHLLKLDSAAQKYPENCATDSVIAKMIAKGDPAVPSTYDCTTDSQQALSDKLGGFSGDGGAVQDDSVKASLDLAHTDLDTIISNQTVGIKKGVERTIVFKMVDATDFATPEPSITVTEERSLDGGAFAACTNAASEIGGAGNGSGWYKITLTATEMNANEIIFKGTGAGCAQCDRLIITEA